MLGLIVNPVNSIVWGGLMGPLFTGTPAKIRHPADGARPAMAELYKKKGWELRFPEQLGCMGDR